MVLTLYLISTNVYNSVDAPSARGFSYIEVWMLGTQLPILLALLEYGFVLCYKKINYKMMDETQVTIQEDSLLELNDKRIRMLDFGTMIFSFAYFIIFATFYWLGSPFDYLYHL